MAIRPQWIENNLITHLGVADLEPNPNQPKVPLLIDMATNEDDKAVMRLIFGSGVIGRAWLAPPRVPADRVAALRTAFSKALNDPEAATAAKSRRMHWDPQPWQKLQAAAVRIADTDDKVIANARKALGLKSKK